MSDLESRARPAGTERGRRDLFTPFLVVACIALAALVFFLARQNRELKARVAGLETQAMPPGTLKTGDRVEPMTLLAESGVPTVVEFGSSKPKTLLLVFSAHCPACEKTLPLWNPFAVRVAATGTRVVGIQLDKGQSASAVVARFPVYAVTKPEPAALGKLPYVPAAVVLDGHGIVVKAWFGIPAEGQLEEIDRLLS